MEQVFGLARSMDILTSPSLSVMLLVLEMEASCLSFSSSSMKVGSPGLGWPRCDLCRPKSIDLPGEGRPNLFILTLEVSLLGSSVMAGRTWEMPEKENTEELSLMWLAPEFRLLLVVDLDHGLIRDL